MSDHIRFTVSTSSDEKVVGYARYLGVRYHEESVNKLWDRIRVEHGGVRKWKRKNQWIIKCDPSLVRGSKKSGEQVSVEED